MEGKNHVLQTRVSEVEYEEIKRRAAELHLTVSAYVRMIIFGRKDHDRA
jgi:predicted DNA binding CopG/RHH family protein